MRIIRKSDVIFADDKLEKEFNSLGDNEIIKKWIMRAIEDIKQNAFCATPIPKRLIPVEYKKNYEVDNLWKYDLPDGWRLIYSVMTPNKIEILSVILEWFDHKEYERRFGY